MIEMYSDQKGDSRVRKTITALILALCLLSGCAAFETALIPPPTAMPDQAASALPLPPPSAEASAPAAVSPPPEATATPSAAPELSQPSVDSPIDETQPPVIIPQQDALSEQLDHIFADLDEFSGSVLIMRSKNILLNKSYGMADSETGIMNTPDTKFLIGSVTKQFTAMAVMQLYEKGLLDINDRLSSYLPDFSRSADITLENLLTHTSGIMDYMNDDIQLLPEIPHDALSVRYIINLVGEKPLKFEPGLKYAYSNTNYLILGYIIEVVSGLSYGDYLALHIFEPLAMKNTGVIDINHLPEGMAAGHMRYGVPVRYYSAAGEIIADSANSAMGSYGAGCLYSTVWDLYLWDLALSTEKLLSKRYIDMMFNPSVPIPDAEIEGTYGYGWVIENDPDVGTIRRHTGSLSGFRAYNGLFADRGETVIILYNIKAFVGRDEMLPAVKQVLSAS